MASSSPESRLAKMQAALAKAKSLEQLDTAIKEAADFIDVHRQLTIRASVLKRVASERRRSALLSETRLLAKGERLANKFTATAAMKKPKRGRPSRFPGRCLACVYRHEKRAGGPAHDIKRCALTKAFLRAGQ